MSKPAVLIIDDEPPIRKLLEINLSNAGYCVRMASTGKEGIMLAASYQPDFILLDLGLPDMDGQEILKQLREWYGKVIVVLSVQNSEEDIVTALDNGANDYLTKPFRVGELMARLRSATRFSAATEAQMVIETGELEIDLTARTVRSAGVIMKLTSTEYSLLALLAKNEGRVLTHHFLLKEIWGIAYQTETQYLRVFVAQLRKKIEPDPNHPRHIITESGVGYRFQ